MGDIDFEEQLELERLDREKKQKEAEGPPSVKVDEDGTTYEWDPEKKAWFPKVGLTTVTWVFSLLLY